MLAFVITVMLTFCFLHPDFSLKLVVDCLLKLSLFNRLELASK